MRLTPEEDGFNSMNEWWVEMERIEWKRRDENEEKDESLSENWNDDDDDTWK